MTYAFESRFWERVDLALSGCWEWTGHIANNGYGQVYVPGHSSPVLVHRLAYTYLVGPIPEGLTIDHLCRNKACVRPDHLEAVTGKINILRGTSFSAVNAAKTHCPRTHPYTAENLRIDSTGRRHCRICDINARPSRRNGSSELSRSSEGVAPRFASGAKDLGSSVAPALRQTDATTSLSERTA